MKEPHSILMEICKGSRKQKVFLRKGLHTKPCIKKCWPGNITRGGQRKYMV
jgi:hypothetical protein